MAYKQAALEPYMQLVREGKKYTCATCPYCNGTRDATVRYPKKPSFEFWETTLHSPRTVVGPMVDQSELPFRMLCRKYGADLAYTPMLHARLFSQDEEYRKQHFTTCPEDRPLVVQFCANDPDMVLSAARYVEDDCDAVDINLGCPQEIARRGCYGSFLMEQWDTIHTVIHTLAVELKVPVFAKMRIFDDDELTKLYASMLRDAGAAVVCVHGRTRAMRGVETGMANLDIIRTVRECIGGDVPVISNGNILTYDDIEKSLELTGCQAVMSAEGLLWDPRLFADPKDPVLTGRSFTASKAARLAALETAREYLEFVQKYPVDLGFAKAHLFKILFHSLDTHHGYRERLGNFDTHDGTLRDLENLVEDLLVLEQGSVDESDILPTRPREGHGKHTSAAEENSHAEGANGVDPVSTPENEDDFFGIDFTV